MIKTEKNKNYFNEETEKAIILYNKSTNIEERNKIYVDYLEYPLNKLVENVIHTYKLYNTGVEYKDLVKTILEYLIEKIGRVNNELGKGYSYLTVTARNYGIMLSIQEYNKSKNEFSDVDCLEMDSISLNKYDTNSKNEELSEFFSIFESYIRRNLTDIFTERKEIEIADAFLDFFNSVGDIEEFNKKALYIIIREKTKCESRFITAVVNVLKANYYELYQLYKNNNIEGIKYFIPINNSKMQKKKKITYERK